MEDIENMDRLLETLSLIRTPDEESGSESDEESGRESKEESGRESKEESETSESESGSELGNERFVLVESVNTDEQEDLSPPLKVYDPDVQLTSEPDMITFDDDKNGLRAKMPCGHAIGPESLTAYCRSLLTAGKYEFRCPHVQPECNRLWDFFTIKKFAVLTIEERQEFEEKIAMNYLTNAIKIQECPQCHSYCERKNKTNVRLICPLCSRKGPRFEFCWFCLKSWKTMSITKCGNEGCSGEDPRFKVLRECKEKLIYGVKCPSVRACPKCGLMIEHKTACKQMTCRCGQKFCFICLKMANSLGQCGLLSLCKKAPIQTEIP